MEAIRRDFRTLRAKALAEKWTDFTPVPPSVFGPLWPDEKPAFAKLVVKALVKPGVSPEALRKGLVELYEAMDEYHQAAGAGRLSLEEFRRFVQIEVLVPVEV